MLRSEAVSLWISLAEAPVQKVTAQHQWASVKTEVSNAKTQKHKEREVKVSKTLLGDLCIFAPLRWKLNRLALAEVAA